MACSKCQGTGYVESYRAVAASYTPILLQCPLSCNVAGYSAEVARRLNDPDHVTERPVLKAVPSERPLALVIPFGRRV